MEARIWIHIHVVNVEEEEEVVSLSRLIVHHSFLLTDCLLFIIIYRQIATSAEFNLPLQEQDVPVLL